MGSGGDMAYREPIGRKDWERDMANTRIARLKLDRLAREDREREFDQHSDEIVGDLHHGRNLLDRVTFARVVRWILWEREAEGDAALRSGVLTMGDVTIERVRS